ncbi:hypothetical protein Acor_52410 [Acrocarpospora corrugata]|uniref:Tryptophan synthase beta chain-like PALP domain-containing protein n=1 Tax=Acrocarpospora corrugata TaxID=35763 RepID=A0A5M3W2B4_9ACTN|nr:hypothetical protein Acor_52410 [Acrocarpospora corrugata]
MATVQVKSRGRIRHLLLKRESFNPTGSVKDRTALGLLRALDAREELRPGSVVVESTSGNLGLALAHLLDSLDCRLIAVVDPKTPEATLRQLSAAGVQLHWVDVPDGHGGYLLSRLEAVAELRRKNTGYRWTNQYGNPANPLIHQQTTGPEIVAQGGRELDAVYVAVSTGGTLAGIAAHIRPLRRPIRLVAVDAAASLATTGAVDLDRRPGMTRTSRLVPGIGASRPSSFLRSDSYDRAVAVTDAMAIATARIFLEDTGIGLGGSAGSVVSACVHDLAEPGAPRLPLCLAADDADKYAATLYDDGWLTKMDLLHEVTETISRFRSDGLEFSADSSPN